MAKIKQLTAQQIAAIRSRDENTLKTVLGFIPDSDDAFYGSVNAINQIGANYEGGKFVTQDEIDEFDEPERTIIATHLAKYGMVRAGLRETFGA